MQFKNIPQNILTIFLFLRKLYHKGIVNRQSDKFTTRGLKKFLERDHHEAKIFPTMKKLLKSELVSKKYR